MGAGNYRTRVVFSAMSEEVDAFRQPIQTLAPVLTVGANVSQLPARERENFGLSSSNASEEYVYVDLPRYGLSGSST